MAKRKTSSVTFNKQAFLLPKMEVTEFGFYVRELSGRAALEVKELADKRKDQTLGESLDLLALMVVRGACDKNGRPVFTDEDIPLLMDKTSVLLPIAEKVMALSYMTVDGEATNNLKNAPNSSTTTELPTS